LKTHIQLKDDSWTPPCFYNYFSERLGREKAITTLLELNRVLSLLFSTTFT
jgi:hypothetical protein